MIFPDEGMIEKELKEFIQESGYRYEHFNIDLISDNHIRDHQRDAFRTGAQWAISHIKAQSSEGGMQGFLKWWDSHVKECYRNHPIPLDVEGAWQAATISRDLHWQKIVDEKDDKIKEAVTSYERCFAAFCDKDSEVKRLDNNFRTLDRGAKKLQAENKAMREALEEISTFERFKDGAWKL
jgi:hypothetical protein